MLIFGFRLNIYDVKGMFYRGGFYNGGAFIKDLWYLKKVVQTFPFLLFIFSFAVCFISSLHWLLRLLLSDVLAPLLQMLL